MREFEGKTVEDAVSKACKELNVAAEELKYEVLSEVKSLFKKSAKIGVYELDDVTSGAEKYLLNLLRAMNLEAETQVTVKDGIIHLDMTSEHDANRIIGRGGETLRAFNELVRSAIFSKFGEHYRILLNINNYKDQKYEKLEAMAKRIARSVKSTRITAELNPMTSDERRVIHNALADDVHIKTVSVGTGKDRHITIQYVNYVPGEEPEGQENEAAHAEIDKAFEAKDAELTHNGEEEAPAAETERPVSEQPAAAEEKAEGKPEEKDEEKA